ncbi:hypothetical protein J2T12_002994 [Paenibacillus anaericanus]|nr:hypothetical protein [Paenibacillus anaericanus]
MADRVLTHQITSEIELTVERTPSSYADCIPYRRSLRLRADPSRIWVQACGVSGISTQRTMTRRRSVSIRSKKSMK